MYQYISVLVSPYISVWCLRTQVYGVSVHKCMEKGPSDLYADGPAKPDRRISSKSYPQNSVHSYPQILVDNFFSSILVLLFLWITLESVNIMDTVLSSSRG